MFTISDYWKIFQYLSGQTVPDLDGTLQILSDAERTKVRTLFTDTIDQTCFNSEDYKRTRKFLIDWYSGFRTLGTIQKHTSDPFILPQKYLDELIKSFGFQYPSDILSLVSRVNFFLDLVNLYKIKGTPLAVKSAIDYYGLKDTDLAEYWLQKDEQGELVFRGVSVFPESSVTPWPDITFETINTDPHWLQSKPEILELVRRNVIALPSKTPYFGLRPAFDISNVQVVFAILTRKVEDQYSGWASTGNLQKDVRLSYLNYTVSLLELYLSCVYTFNNYYNYGQESSPDSTSTLYICYDGNLENVHEITQLYDNIAGYPEYNPDDPVGEKAYRESRIEEFYSTFTRAGWRNFIQEKSSAGEYLGLINSDLKSSLDSWISSGRQYELLANLLQDLTGWVKVHIGPEFSDIISIVLGVEAFVNIKRLVNTFKPYRARLLGIQFCYVIDNPLFDTVRIYDSNFYIRYILPFYDWATANSLSCCSPDLIGECYADSTSIIEPIRYSREYYDCGSYFDIGISWDDPVQYFLTQYLDNSLNCHVTPWDTLIPWDTTAGLDEISFGSDWEATFREDVLTGKFTNSELQILSDNYWYQQEAVKDSTSDIIFDLEDLEPGEEEGLDTTSGNLEILISGGFLGFDWGWVFDCPGGCDLVKVETGVFILEANFYGIPRSGISPLLVQFTDTSLYPPQSVPTDWAWTFGDGNISEEENPANIYVSPRLNGPVSSWSYNKSGPLTVSFMNDCIGDPSSLNFQWDFGDGTFSNEKDPVHNFPRMDVFLVKLSAVNPVGSSIFEACIHITE